MKIEGKSFTYLTIITTLMFLWSGVGKVLSFGQKEAQRFAQKLPMIPKQIVPLIIILAGLWELAGAAGAIYASTNPKIHRNLGVWSTLSLAAFTVAATLVFYLVPFKTIPFLANLTAIGGLLSLAYVYTCV